LFAFLFRLSDKQLEGEMFMAKKTATVGQWIGNRRRFANVFNVKIFDGAQVIKPEELEPIEGETHILMQTKDGKQQEIHRYRDITMRWKGKMDLMILACENQDKIHYAMPVRTMIYDGLSYVQQMKLMWGLRDETDKITNDEFLSKFCKEDKLCPVITLVFYFGEKEWDASLDLYGMFDVEGILRTNDDLRKYIPNYTINLIDAERIENLEMYQKDLQVIFGLLKCRKDKQKLRHYVEDNQDFFKSVDVDTGMAISSFINSNRIMNEMKNQNEGGRVNMCKAMEDWAAEERAEGGEEKLVNQIRKKLEKGKDIATIADEVEETEDVVKKLMEKHNL